MDLNNIYWHLHLLCLDRHQSKFNGTVYANSLFEPTFDRTQSVIFKIDVIIGLGNAYNFKNQNSFEIHEHFVFILNMLHVFKYTWIFHTYKHYIIVAPDQSHTANYTVLLSEELFTYTLILHDKTLVVACWVSNNQ